MKNIAKSFIILMLLGTFINAQTHFTFTSNTGNNGTIVVQTSANPNIDGAALASGDEIGAFTPSGLCVGAIVWSESNSAITVWGDNDQTPAVDGIKNGEQIYYRLWDKSADKEYSSVDATYSSGSGTYLPDAMMILSSLTGHGVPEKGSLKSPTDGSTNSSLTPNMEWNSLTNATSYKVQISDKTDFSNLIINVSGISVLSYTVPSSKLIYSTKYYWRVAGANQVGTGVWSDSWNFTTLAIPVPNAPTLKAPTNNSVGVSLNNIKLDWDAILHGETYNLQVATDNAYSNLIVNLTGLSATENIVNNLTPLTNYYWRVSATNTSGTGNWSSTWIFKTLGEPTIVNLLTPIADAVNQQTSTTFTWSKATDKIVSPIKNKDGIQLVSLYWFELSKNINSTSYLIDSNLTSTSKLVSNLENATEYWWRVKSKNEAGWSELTTWRKFTTIVANSGTVILQSPTNNAQINAFPITITWLKADLAESYTIEVSKVNNFSSIEFTSSKITDLNVSLNDVYQQTKYYWRVKAVNVGGESPWSEVWSFTITNNAPEMFSLKSPMKNSSIANQKPTFVWNKSKEVDKDDVVNYKLYLDTPEPGIITYNVGADTNFTLNSNLEDNTDYFWKVVATDSHGSSVENDGGYWKFNLNTLNQPPNEFALITPTFASVEVTRTPFFYWEATGDPDIEDTVSYELLIAKDILLSPFISYNLKGNSITSIDILDDNSFFFWNVVAKDKFGAVTISDTSVFVVNTILEPPYDIVPLEPANGSGIEQNTLFVWSKAKDNDPLDYAVYKLYVSTDSSFNKYDLIVSTNTDTTFQLNGELPTDKIYYWYVEAIDTDSLITKSQKRTITGVNSFPNITPSNFSLMQNYPNPFNPSTIIIYAIPKQSNVQIKVYDILGSEVATLVNETQNAGYYDVSFNATNLSNGIYFYKIQASNFVDVKKMILLK